MLSAESERPDGGVPGRRSGRGAGAPFGLHGASVSCEKLRGVRNRDTQCMASANAGFVDRLVEAWNRSDVDAILALFDPECEVVFAPEVPEPGPFHGHAELRQWACLPTRP